MIHLIFGTQGAGKSTYAIKLANKVNGVHLSIDDWMQDLFSQDLPTPKNIGWIMARVKRCEKKIWSTALQIVQSGGSVILDLGFMKIENRSLYIALAKENGIQIELHFITAELSTRYNRVMQRNLDKDKTYSFQVTPTMFHYMENEFETPSEDELKAIVIVNTDDPN
ncbi:ATP-binding protein [Pedobacter frigidisoli]|uniref:ATP-binding protein n=1 Tax=Pedobacter frigidisoli TaxID=2530455 RepID=A0A4R0P6C8_9SPHI|nr:AAA family ATPase [Pedobacter frigidisoli]TCD11028.1 ATP-binding protein [Pedobacter frigidisoli]